MLLVALLACAETHWWTQSATVMWDLGGGGCMCLCGWVEVIVRILLVVEVDACVLEGVVCVLLMFVRMYCVDFCTHGWINCCATCMCVQAHVTPPRAIHITHQHISCTTLLTHQPISYLEWCVWLGCEITNSDMHSQVIFPLPTLFL